MKYRRSHAVEMGRRLVAQDQMKALHRDMGGGLRWNAIGQFAPNPAYGLHPSQTIQIPPAPGPGGYTSAPNQNTSPAQVMMAMQPQAHASGGAIDENALAEAHALGQVGGYKAGGEVPIDAPHVSEAKRLLKLWDKIEAEHPRIPADRQFGYLCQRAPGIARFLKLLLQDGWSRSGARAQINGALTRWANGEE